MHAIIKDLLGEVAHLRKAVDGLKKDIKHKKKKVNSNLMIQLISQTNSTNSLITQVGTMMRYAIILLLL